MVDWSKINSKEFEKLAYDYISSKYPDMNWEPTKSTRDGNKDGEATYIAPLDITIKYWYEAKFSKTIDRSIPKNHLDSTLVSSLLDGKVVLIAFITNAYISDDYRRRADIFSKQCENLKIIYINGCEIEDWLCINPHVEIKYFLTNTAKRQDFKDYIKSSCILQNYDLYGNHFTKVKNIECGKEYILYLSFYSTCTQVNSISSENTAIKLLNKENKKYDHYNELNSFAGFNSFYIPIIISNTSDKPILFKLSCTNNELYFTVNNVSIIDMYNPQITYGSQIEIQNHLFNLIEDRDMTNAVFYIIGNAGNGKSYLLNNLYSNSLNPFSSYVINFTGEENTDTIRIYQMIILSLYGNIWEYINDSEDLFQLNDIESLMIQQIKNFKLIGNCINQITLYYKNNKEYIENNVTQTQILVDDFHKLSTKNLLLIEEFFKWFMKQRYNCKIFVFSRPEAKLPCSYTKKFTINSISPNDIEATIENNFIGIRYLSTLIKKYPMPLNALHFINILCQIHSMESNLLNKTELEAQILLNKIYDNSKEVTCISFGNQILSNYKNNSIVYCVFKIKTGISIDAIHEYFGERSCENIYNLCQNRIFKESSNIILPYHDILVSAFNSFDSNKMNSELEAFVLFAQKHKYISKAKMFSILIGIGKHCFWKYRNEARLYRDELHKCAEYYQALEIAKTLKESNNKSLDNYDLDDCKNQFVMANCIKYTNSYEKANVEFEKIRHIYELTQNPDIHGLYLETETEIINNLIWMLDVKSAKMRLERLSSTLEDMYLKNQIVGHNLIYAFLNYYNRLMFVNYMLDEGSVDDYNNAVKYSKEFKQDEYVAFAKMDYAKSLYYEDLELAEILMNQAIKHLVNYNEKRRALDAEAEKCFINDIFNKTISYDTYSNIKNKMIENHYIQSEIKIELKLIMLKLLYTSISSTEIRNQLDNIAINNTSIESGKRHQAFINHIYAASYYKQNNFVISKKYTLKSLSLMKNMGKSYQFIHHNNSNLIEYNGFITLNEINNIEDKYNKFIFDIRLW